MKRVTTIAIILAVLSLLIYNLTGLKSSQKVRYKAVDPPQQIVNADKEGLAPNRYINALVTKVADGDTLNVAYKGKSHTVRLLDIDTPESVKPGVPVQSYAKEAAEFTKKLTLKRNVKLVFDKSLMDRYKRLLAYVILEDGTFLNAVLVKNGFARVQIVKPNVKYSDYFYKLQDEAIEERVGMWSLPQSKQPFIKNEKGEYVQRKN